MAIHFTTPLTFSRSQSLTQEPYHQYVILHMTDHSFTRSVYDETSRLATVQSQWSEWCAVSSELGVTSEGPSTQMLCCQPDPRAPNRDKKDGHGGQQRSEKTLDWKIWFSAPRVKRGRLSITSDEVLLLLRDYNVSLLN